MNTVRVRLSAFAQTSPSCASGTARVSILSPARGAISSTMRNASSNIGIGTLPMPLPISVIAVERSTAAGKEISPPPIAPICT